MNDYKLTDNQSLVMTYLAAATQEGLYLDETNTFGVWFDTLNTDLVGTVPTKAQAKAALNQLVKKRIFGADTTIEEGSTWVTLTVAGVELLEAFGEDDAPAEEAAVEAPEEEAPAPEEEEEDLLGDVEAAPEEEEEDLLGDVADLIAADDYSVTEAGSIVGGVEATIGVHADFDKVSTDQVVSHTENYTVNERTDNDGTEWTETVFVDGSRTIKRRRLVSESWRTDYWGAEFFGDKERATTAKLAKLARAAGHFTHNPLPAAA